MLDPRGMGAWLRGAGGAFTGVWDMVTIRLHNSKTRKKEVFAPIDPANVRVYVCGPTVYDRAHLGNARPVVVFDTLFRLLRHVYGPEHVTYVRNFTDVDDKINATALARKEAGAEGTLEQLIAERTEETIRWYHEDMDALGALRPAIRGVVSQEAEPRATAYVGQMIAMIGDLIARGHAYAKEGHVLFRVRSFKDYGRLSGRSVDDMIAGARVEVAPFKEDPMDFVLWKPSDDSLPGWASPWGRGRPGWHIECSAMSLALLGASFDIHGGGIDLQFPHHENEVAQSCCAHPEADFARVWMHNEMLQVEGKKMSKSLGNFFTVRDLLEQGIPGEVIRFVFLGTHYRKPMDWTAEKEREASLTLASFHNITKGLVPTPEDQLDLDPKFLAALADDLNTHLARTVLMGMKDEPQKLLDHARFLGLLSDDRRGLMATLTPYGGAGASPMLADLAASLDLLRKKALETKDFAPVDAMKAALVAAGVEVRMSKAGVELLPGPGFDAARLEGLG